MICEILCVYIYIYTYTHMRDLQVSVLNKQLLLL